MTTLDFERLVTIGFETIALITGLICRKKYKGTVMNSLTFYLLFIVVCEITGNRLFHYNYKMANNYLFTLFVIPLEFLFFNSFFYRIFKSKRAKTFILFSSVIILGVLLIEELLLKQSGKYFFMSLFYSCGNLLLLIILVHYFLLFIKSGNMIYFKNNPVFWVVVGLLLFYLGTFPLFSMYNLLWELDKDLFRKYYTIQFVLNWSMYFLFTIAYIWGKPKFIHSL